MILTETQAQTMEYVKGYLAEHDYLTADDLAAGLNMPVGTARDRLNALEAKKEIQGARYGRKMRYTLPGKSGRSQTYSHYVKRKSELNLHPITPEEVEAVKKGMRYKTAKAAGTMVKYLLGAEEGGDGKIVKIIIKLEAVKEYPHGVLFAGKRMRTFVTWNELSLYYRHKEIKPIGSSYGRDEE